MSIVDHAKFLRRLYEGGQTFDCVYDVGANIGGCSADARKVLPDARFEIFEPPIGRYEELDRNARFGEISNDAQHAVALGDENGQCKIKVLGDRGVGSSILLLDLDERKPTRFEDVPVFRMDDYVSKHGLGLPDFIKLDTRASGKKILAGAARCLAHAKYFLVETWMRRFSDPRRRSSTSSRRSSTNATSAFSSCSRSKKGVTQTARCVGSTRCLSITASAAFLLPCYERCAVHD